ncbi:MAG TPA: hypothetical protein VLU25_06790 [Acidobacteriota bacterium]|nr:hypothetical protein [Acidobacteriota bacterium]
MRKGRLFRWAAAASITLIVLIGVLGGFQEKIPRASRVAGTENRLPGLGQTFPESSRITFSPRHEAYPAWDNGGEQIAYIIDPNQFGSGAAIGLASADGTSEGVAAIGPPSPLGFAGSLSWVGQSGLLMLAETTLNHEYLTFDSSLAPFTRTVEDGSDPAFDVKLRAAFANIGGGLGGYHVIVSRDGSRAAWRVSSVGRCGDTEMRVGLFAELDGQFADQSGTLVLEEECTFPQRPRFIDGFDLTPDGSRLVISLPRDEQNTFDGIGAVPGDLVILNSDGSGSGQFLTNSGSYGVANFFPRVSPDGTRVAFTRRTAGGPNQIYTVNLDGTQLTQITESPASHPTWSPDGRRIAFSVLDQDGGNPNFNIHVVDLEDDTGPFLSPAPDLDVLRQALVDSDFDDVPEPGQDNRLIVEREGNLIRVFQADTPDIVWQVICSDPHPVTGRFQSCAVDPPTFPPPSSFWQRLKKAFLRQVMGVDADRHIISADRFDQSYRLRSLVVESEVEGQSTQMSSVAFQDNNQDGVTDDIEIGGFLFLPSFSLNPLLADVTGDGNPDFAGWPITFEGGRYFLPLADSNGDGVPDTTLLDFDRNGLPDPGGPRLAEFLTGPPPGDAELTFHFAQFANGGASQGVNLSSTVALFNPNEAASAEVEVEIRGDDGQLLTVNINGAPVEGTTSLSIPAGGLRLLQTDGEGEITAGSVSVTSDRAIGGNLLFGGSAGFAGVGISHVMEGGFSAIMESDQASGTRTGIAVHNLGGSPSQVRFSLFDSDSLLLARNDLSLAARGHRALFVDEFQWQSVNGSELDFSQFRGVLEADSPMPLAATVLQSRPGEIATLPVANRFLSRDQIAIASRRSRGQTPPADLFQKLYFAHFGDGGEGLSLFSQILLLNLSSRQASVRIILRDDQGAPLTVDLEGEEAEGQRNLTLPAGALRILTTDGEGPLVTGSVTVCSDQALAGLILFGGDVGVAGVGAGSLLRNGFFSPMERIEEESLNTGLALMNLEESSVALELRLHNSDGDQIASAELTLPPLGHRALFVNEIPWAEEELDLSRFSGLLTASTSGKVSVLVLRTQPGVFATQPVIPSLN